MSQSRKLEPSGQVPIRFIDIDLVEKCGSFPCFDVESKDNVTENIGDIDINNCLLIYVAHHWLRGPTSGASRNNSSSNSTPALTPQGAVPASPGAVSQDAPAVPYFPDDEENHHFKLTVQGVKQALLSFAPGMQKCYVWIDYCCLGSDEATSFRENGNIGNIIKLCDCLFTPIYDEASSGVVVRTESTYSAVVNNWYDEYGANAWNVPHAHPDAPQAFMNRAWCLLELFYGASTPLLTDGIRCPGQERYLKFAAGLKLHAINEKRPNLLYGSHEQKKGNLPIVLPPLQIIHLETYDPVEGFLSVAEDIVVIRRLMDELQHLIRRPKAGYIGERDADGKLHGQGIYTYANGDVYKGEFVGDRMCGVGTYTSKDGTVYVGDFKNDTMNGRGRYASASGSVYEGDYVNGRRSGNGHYIFASGASYKGTFLDDQMHGRGVYVSVDGCNYEGGYMFDQMHGQAVYKSTDGSTYVGGFSEGRKHGHGVLSMANGKVFTGIYVSGKKHGPGIIESPGCKAKHVNYLNGVRINSMGAMMSVSTQSMV